MGWFMAALGAVGKVAGAVSKVGSALGGGSGTQQQGPNNAGLDQGQSGSSGGGGGGNLEATLNLYKEMTAKSNLAQESAITGKIGSPASSGSKMSFYGGETVNQIKSSRKINITGGPSGLNKTPDDIKFYSNVRIPRKKV